MVHTTAFCSTQLLITGWNEKQLSYWLHAPSIPQTGWYIPRPFVQRSCWSLAGTRNSSVTDYMHHRSHIPRPFVQRSCWSLAGTRNSSVTDYMHHRSHRQGGTYHGLLFNAVVDHWPGRETAQLLTTCTIDPTYHGLLFTAVVDHWPGRETAQLLTTCTIDPTDRVVHTTAFCSTQLLITGRDEKQLSYWLHAPSIPHTTAFCSPQLLITGRDEKQLSYWLHAPSIPQTGWYIPRPFVQRSCWSLAGTRNSSVTDYMHHRSYRQGGTYHGLLFTAVVDHWPGRETAQLLTTCTIDPTDRVVHTTAFCSPQLLITGRDEKQPSYWRGPLVQYSCDELEAGRAVGVTSDGVDWHTGMFTSLSVDGETPRLTMDSWQARTQTALPLSNFTIPRKYSAKYSIVVLKAGYTCRLVWAAAPRPEGLPSSKNLFLVIVIILLYLKKKYFNRHGGEHTKWRAPKFY